jgi:hypothetical protein
MSTFTIGDLVKRDQQAEFRNDVQLSSYEDVERNRSLVCSYLFTSTAPQGTYSSTNILYNAVDTYLSDRLENRFVVIANYGHGKSHLALALANYFSKPYPPTEDQPEIQIILDKINKAFSNSPSALRYTEFKENRGEFLVVRIRGDVAGSLREQFLVNLEKALGEHKIPQLHLIGWYAKAESYLAELKGETLEKANKFLEQSGLDIPMLIREIEQKQDSAYDIFRNLYANLDPYGYKPDMGGEISLADAINWAAKEFCGEGKLLGGILILFDEFSLYVNNYAKRSAAGDLQDMLNGVSNNQGKVVFIAFAQQDPNTTAQNAFASGNSEQRDSLLKELTRIPKKFVLHSLLESVIDSYLDQPEDKWQRFVQDSKVSLPLASATNIAYEHFRDRYEKLGWTSLQTFEEKVTKGCFPLHPITTALLCSMQFQQSITSGGTPRNILGFILERLDSIQEQPAVIGTRINWILPIYLVDYFNERLPVEWFQAYLNSVQRIKTGDEQAEFTLEDQTDVLKALLIQEISSLKKVHDEDQIELIASMVGMFPADAKKCLRFMSDTKVIEWDQYGKKSYSLYSTSTDPKKLDQILSRKLVQVELTLKDLISCGQGHFGDIKISVPWGNPGDWLAHEYILDSENFNAETLKILCQYFSISKSGSIKEGNRGYVIWLIAGDNEEVAKYRKDAQKVLGEAFPEDDPLPLVVMLPSDANAELLDALKRKKALDSFSNAEREEANQDIYRIRCRQEIVNIEYAISALRGSENYRDIPRRPIQYIIPSPYQKHIQELGQINLTGLLDGLYKVAYRFSPPEFFTQYALSSTKLRNNVKTISIGFMHNDSASLTGTIRANSSIRDVVTLLQNKWGLLTSDYRIKIPEQSRISKAWELLEDTFPANESDKPVRPALQSLANSPYGYDYNTITLLFCLWYGYNSHDLVVRYNGERSVLAEALDNWLQAGPKDFIYSLCFQNITLARRDVTKITKAVMHILSKAKIGGFRKVEAEEAIAELESFMADERNDSSLIAEAGNTDEDLRAGLESYQVYEDQAKKIMTSVNHEKNIKALFGLLQMLSTLTENTLVLPDSPSASELRNSLMLWVENVVEEQCEILENLREITYLKYNQSQLEELRAELSRASLPDLVKRVNKSLKVLESKGDELRDKAQEARIQSAVKAMNPNASLKDLYGSRDILLDISGVSSETLRLRDQQLTAINNEITKLEGFAENAKKQLDKVGGVEDFEKFRQILHNLEWRYEGTPHKEVVQKLNARVNELRLFYDDLIQLSKRRADTPDEAGETKRLLNSLGRKYIDVIGDDQRSLIEKAQSYIDENVKKRELSAINWLEELEAQQITVVNLPQFRNFLENPPVFLPEKEKKRVDVLKQQVDKRLDDNVVEQIMSFFMRIKDENLRKKCLTRLQEIMKDKKE